MGVKFPEKKRYVRMSPKRGEEGLQLLHSDRNKEIISLVRRTSATSKSLVGGSPHLSNK